MKQETVGKLMGAFYFTSYNTIAITRLSTPFSDITLYTPTPHKPGSQGYIEQTSRENFISELYVRKMNGYKPPKTTRITIQPAFFDIWESSWHIGSVVSIAPFYSYQEYARLDLIGQYRYILDLIHMSSMSLSEEKGWNTEVFKNAYDAVIHSGFKFRLAYPMKLSRNRRKGGQIVIEKTERRTSVYVQIEENGSLSVAKLFEKENRWWYDCCYVLAKHSKWIDSDIFGISYGSGKIDAWYSLVSKSVTLREFEKYVVEIDFIKFFGLG